MAMARANPKYIAFFIFFILFIPSVWEQDSTLQNSFHIKIHDIIKSESDVENPDFLDRISDIFFGRNNLELSKPFSLIVNNSEQIIVLDHGIESIVIIDTKEDNFYKISPKQNFTSLISICSLDTDNYLFTDSQSNSIFKLNIPEETIIPFQTSTALNRPTGIGYISSKKEIWISETGHHRISVFDRNGKFIKFIGKRGTGDAEFNFPTNIWVDNFDTIFVIDALNFRIQLFDLNGNFISQFGKQGDATGYFARPKDVATDKFGNIYIVDALFHSVQVFNRSGEYLYNFGTQGSEEGNFWLPTGIFIDNNNFIYVADSYNSRIQIFKIYQN